MVNWNELPDLGAVGLLTAAFASVARRNQTHISRTWLTGWVMIALHFTALLFVGYNGGLGNTALVIGIAALTWAGLLFMWAAVPYREEGSSRLILVSLFFSNTLYLCLSVTRPGAHLSSTCLALTAPVKR